ncbi:hypothetical protein AKJ16_DCAP11839 [Drosera capensis]
MRMGIGDAGFVISVILRISGRFGNDLIVEWLSAKMAPSAFWRPSPGRDIGEVHHKRGRSFENGPNNGEKDDDLELFSELNRIEREGFLLQSSDDFEDVFAMKMKSSPDVKLGITIPARGASSDLLNADGDKNDYDWLLTPPESPLFPSLDDEPAPADLVHSGRPRSRSVSISRSSVVIHHLSLMDLLYLSLFPCSSPV